MTGATAFDSAAMARAMRLAERGRYRAHPNPMVGCVLARDGDIVGEGWHAVAGEAHAEINALEAAGDRARGATAYVTLEPCAHHGKTPPCAKALVAAGVAEVIMAMLDPYPAVRGRGRAILDAAGIATRVGLMQQAAADLNRGFLSRVERGRPWLTLKVASSLDGATAMRDGESQWITGPEARADVQRLRAASGAVMTGIGTVLADDPLLTVRDTTLDTGGRQPLRAVLDTSLRMPVEASMLAMPGTTLVYCGDDSARETLVSRGAEIVRTDGAGGRVELVAVLEDLASREINTVLVEAGPVLCGSLIRAKLVDELVIYQAPHIMGSETRRLFETPAWTRLADRQGLRIVEVRQIGGDLRITARPSERHRCLPES